MYEKFFNISPFHLTHFENLPKVLYMNRLYSKNKLRERGIEYFDLGWLEDEKPEISLRLYKILVCDDGYSVTPNMLHIDLRNYVRFYLFIVKDVKGQIFMSKYAYSKLQSPTICILFFKKLKNMLEYLSREYGKDSYIIILGHPNRKNPAGFFDLESFVNYLNLDSPGIDGIKEWLKYFLDMKAYLDMPLEYFVALKKYKNKNVDDYLRHLLASELIVKDEVEVDHLLECVICNEFIENIPEYEDVIFKVKKFLKLRQIDFKFVSGDDMKEAIYDYYTEKLREGMYNG